MLLVLWSQVFHSSPFKSKLQVAMVNPEAPELEVRRLVMGTRTPAKSKAGWTVSRGNPVQVYALFTQPVVRQIVRPP